MTVPEAGENKSPAAGMPVHGTARRLLDIIAVLLVVAVAAIAAIAVAMVYPLPFDNPLGLSGAVALFFPLHFLVVAAIAAGLAVFACKGQARLAATPFISRRCLSAIIALWPSLAVWRFAHHEDVSLSLGDYLADAAHLNLGAPQPDRTVTYGVAADGAKLVLDVWPAAGKPGPAPRPALVRIHGGAFIQGNRSDMPDWDRWFNGLGYTVFDVGYRLPPPVRWQDEIGDVKCALGWVAAHAGEYGVDPARIGVTGFSAGATLAMLAAYSVGEPRLPPSCDVPPVAVRSVVSL
jgi:acetyl esterase/lipase